jgi:rubrerythrin
VGKRSAGIKRSRAERKKISKALKKALKDGTLTAEMLDKAIEDSTKLACTVKMRYDMEQSEAFMKYMDSKVELYLCPCCGFVHLGHPSGWIKQRDKE